jgi:hypothetical protein
MRDIYFVYSKDKIKTPETSKSGGVSDQDELIFGRHLKNISGIQFFFVTYMALLLIWMGAI